MPEDRGGAQGRALRSATPLPTSQSTYWTLTCPGDWWRCDCWAVGLGVRRWYWREQQGEQLGGPGGGHITQSKNRLENVTFINLDSRGKVTEEWGVGKRKWEKQQKTHNSPSSPRSLAVTPHHTGSGPPERPLVSDPQCTPGVPTAVGPGLPF